MRTWKWFSHYLTAPVLVQEYLESSRTHWRLGWVYRRTLRIMGRKYLLEDKEDLALMKLGKFIVPTILVTRHHVITGVVKGQRAGSRN